MRRKTVASLLAGAAFAVGAFGMPSLSCTQNNTRNETYSLKIDEEMPIYSLAELNKLKQDSENEHNEWKCYKTSFGKTLTKQEGPNVDYVVYGFLGNVSVLRGTFNYEKFNETGKYSDISFGLSFVERNGKKLKLGEKEREQWQSALEKLIDEICFLKSADH